MEGQGVPPPKGVVGFPKRKTTIKMESLVRSERVYNGRDISAISPGSSPYPSPIVKGRSPMERLRLEQNMLFTQGFVNVQSTQNI